MCGRYRLTTKAEDLAARYHARMSDDLHLAPSWNVAPGQDVLAVRLNPETGKRSLDALHWGLIPHWANDKKIGYRTINARSETIDKTLAFRQAFRKRRCLVCADGFYEWRREAGIPVTTDSLQAWEIGRWNPRAPVALAPAEFLQKRPKGGFRKRSKGRGE